jgi:hypothetical protein
MIQDCQTKQNGNNRKDMFEKAKPLELYLVPLINLVKEIDLISLFNLTVCRVL